MVYNPLLARHSTGGESMATSASGEFAHIGKSVSIKGEVSGSEDLYVDGQLEGSVQLDGNSLTIGPNGRVHANVVAKNVTVGGQLDGNIQASERTEMRKSAVVNGDVQTRRIAIEEGAYFKGKLEILPDKKFQNTPGAAAVAASSTASTTPGAPEPKK
jgi:cytoskeletal protein CcmA (bactofilin family)